MGSNIKRIVILMIVLMFVAVAGIVLYANIRSEEKAVQTDGYGNRRRGGGDAANRR